jgi:hypothetical protein
MDDENPYAAAESFSGINPYTSPAPLPTDQFYVDGNLIMCGTPVVLPAICVVTGETEDLVLINKTVEWVPKWIYFTLLVGLLILLIVYLIVRKQCKVSYYMSRRLRNRKRWMVFSGFLCWGFLVMSLIAAGNYDLPEVFVPLGLIAFITSLVLFVLAQQPITAARQENGVRFWLKGFKPAFFDQLRMMYLNPGESYYGPT